MDKNIKRGEIWVINLGNPKGSGQGYTRPCIVISNNHNNRYSTELQVVAITSVNKKDLPVHLKMKQGKFGLHDNSIILGETIQQVNKSQFKYYMDKLDDETMKLVERRIKIQLALV